MKWRHVVIGVGFAIAAIGLAVLFNPGILGLSVTSVGVTIVGALMLLNAALSIHDADATIDQSDPGDPERRRAMPRPGDEADAIIAGVDETTAGPVRNRRRLREWVTDAAISVIARTDRITESEARDRIRDEVYAARRELQVIAELDEESEDTERLVSSLRTELGRLAGWRSGGESPVQESVRRAVNAISRRVDLPALDIDDGYLDDPEAAAERLDSPKRGRAATDGRGTRGRVRIDDGVYRRTHRETGHWTGVVAFAFAFAGVGAVTGQPPLVLAGTVGIGYGAYSRHTEHAGARVAVERSLAASEPDENEETTVQLTVRNVGDRILPDVRVVDGVPERLEVTSGVPRLGTALRPGETATLEYAVTARRGVHEFGDVTLISRDASGEIEDEHVVEEDTSLTCVPTLRSLEAPLPLRNLAAGFVGEVASEPGGGVEFYAVREYRAGDPLGRIDWSRRARTGELATIQLREERSTTVFLLIDTRGDAYVAPDDGDHAVDRGVEAASRLFTALSTQSNPVGIASLGPDRCWLDPGIGQHHEHRAERLLGTHSAFGPLPPRDRSPTLTWLRDIRARLPEECQIVFISPLCDDFAPFVARRLEAFGHPVTVLSPDPTTGTTVGGRLAHLQRRLRVIDIRESGIPVVDWEWEKPLGAALRRESKRRNP